MSVQIIKKFLEIAPRAAGVYQMLNKQGDVIYVGKAKDIRARLTNYTNSKDLSLRILQMVDLVERVEIIQTNNELEALLLESNLIKKFKPKYNILLKDDKSFPYILLKTDHEFPQIVKYRGVKSLQGKYFGPFTSPSKLDEMMSFLQKAFLLRSCSDSYFATRKRPCILFQIKKCSAPCVGKISISEYEKLVEQCNEFLSGKGNELKSHISTLMREASESFNYELAALYRDRLKLIEYIRSKQVIELGDNSDFDVIVTAKLGNAAAIMIFFFRNGQNLGNKVYYPAQTEGLELADVMEQFLLNYYTNNQLPSEILLNIDLGDAKVLTQALCSIAGDNTVKITTPKKGIKHELILFALTNLTQEIEKKNNNTLYHKAMLVELQKLFNWSKEIKRVEIYDNSHISGKYAVGVMVVSGEGGLDKSQYRKYNITLSENGDDYAMMHEVFTRRFKRDLPKPDLILIDGGLGQLSIAAKLIDPADICLVAIAKGVERNAGKEEFYQVGKDKFTLSRDNEMMKYLQKLRDEAHRFAITTHRAKRSKSIRKSELDSIEGVGSKRKKLILQHFGSVESIKSASINELEQVLGKKVAEKVFNHFRS